MSNKLQNEVKNLEKDLHEKGFKHLYVQAKSKHLVVYSKDGDNLVNRARLSSISHGTYQLSMADHTGRWEPTPYTGDLTEITTLLTEDFSFALIDFDEFI